MAVFIKGVGVISPQHTFSGEFLGAEMQLPVLNQFRCIEPDYSTFIDVKMIRRMSRIIRMGVTASMLSLRDADLEKPDAVIVGTAYGCLEDTISFLNKLVINKEEMLNPTAFIHSTHNTIASQIALSMKCKGYNSTYVHRNISFESALRDAQLLLEENAVDSVLVGGIDELTDVSYKILNRLGHFARKNGDVQSLIPTGAEAGEGSAFFTLTNLGGNSAYAEIKSIQTVSFTSPTEVLSKAMEMLSAHQLGNVDLILSGFTAGWKENEGLRNLYSSLVEKEQVYCYKQICGEYPTSTAFGMYLAANILSEGARPPVMENMLKPGKTIRHILIHNNFKNVHHSLILLSAC